jgi:tRNA-2-methylthio-N6-dimethylallyladenosine synthase
MLYHIWTIGCQMNKAESNRIAGYLEHYGYSHTSQLQHADFLVLNTCMVRQSAEDKILGILSSMKGIKKERPELKICVTGCFVNPRIGELETQFPHVDFFFNPGDYRGFLNRFFPNCASRMDMAQTILVPGVFSSTAYIPIIQGCNNFCSYCIVPYRRGREKSRPVKEIVDEINKYVEQGVREITILGQNVNSYGHDLVTPHELSDLLRTISAIDTLKRIRFLTNHPKDMSDSLIQAIADIDKVCEHISLPFQSGDNNILKAMRRSYTIEHYRELIASIRKKIPNVAISTDVIVGFPGETEAQFERSIDLLSEIRFDSVHAAAYTPRPGTIATRKYPDDIPSEVKKERLEKMETIQTAISNEINARLEGTIAEVLVEGKKKEKWYGRTRSDKLVFFNQDNDCSGQLVNIYIEKTSPWALQGKPVNIQDIKEK